MKVTNYERLLNELKEALSFDFDVELVASVEFHDWKLFGIHKPTLIINNSVFITYNEAEDYLEILNQNSDEHWFDFYTLKYYTRMELAVVVYKKLTRIFNK